jgi:hypothetical protein
MTHREEGGYLGWDHNHPLGDYPGNELDRSVGLESSFAGHSAMVVDALFPDGDLIRALPPLPAHVTTHC